MSIAENRQQENVTRTKIIDNLIALKKNYGFKNYEIARRLEIGESYLSSVFNGSKDGSKQLLAGLQLLLELEQLKKTLAEKENTIAEFQREKEYLRNLFRPTAPYLMNEPASSTAADHVAGEAEGPLDVIDEAKRRAAASRAKAVGGYKAPPRTRKKGGA